MSNWKNIKRSDFNFELPDQYIAKYPLPQRDESKLLVYRNAEIEINSFKNIDTYLDQDHLLIFNEAKVIPARLYFKRATGAVIEVLLLEPIIPANYEQVFKSTEVVSWKCIIGNLKKWKEGEVVFCRLNDELNLSATIVDREERIVEFSWDGDQNFLSIIEVAGNLPIPPYLNRETEESDYNNYQTIFAKNDGSVAAPTAALHFTDAVLDSLKAKGAESANLTLHVGAGTFLPIKDDNVVDHPMHREMFEVSKATLRRLLSTTKRIAVGTTSLRVLESLYFIGQQIAQKGDFTCIGKLEPYNEEHVLSYEESIQKILDYLDLKQLDTLYGATEILILPEYRLKSVVGLITNFHLPESTLLMLVASAVGDAWKEIYHRAKEENFRFLSYGDSSLLFVD